MRGVIGRPGERRAGARMRWRAQGEGATEPVVTASVLIIGNEILSGRTQDANLQHIATVLGEQGVRVAEARVIPDVEDVIVAALNEARARFDHVLTTGGIGPTHDDITAVCVAKAFGVPLVMNEAIRERISARPAPAAVMAARLRMARIPRGAELIENATGGPQGFRIENVYVMAGIPAVMRAMLSTVRLRGGAVVRSRTVTAYLGESEVAAGLERIQNAFPGIDLGSYPFTRDGKYGTTLVMRGTDPAALEAMLEEVKALIVQAGETPRDIE